MNSASRPGVAYETDGITCVREAAMLGGQRVQSIGPALRTQAGLERARRSPAIAD